MSKDSRYARNTERGYKKQLKWSHVYCVTVKCAACFDLLVYIICAKSGFSIESFHWLICTEVHLVALVGVISL